MGCPNPTLLLAASCVSVFSIIKKGASLHNHNPKGIFSSTGRQRRSCPPQIKLAEPAYARSTRLPSVTAPTDSFPAPHFSGPPWRSRPAPRKLRKAKRWKNGSNRFPKPWAGHSVSQGFVTCLDPGATAWDELQEPIGAAPPSAHSEEEDDREQWGTL